MKKTVNYSTLGNVITFNKTPTTTENLNSNQNIKSNTNTNMNMNFIKSNTFNSSAPQTLTQTGNTFTSNKTSGISISSTGNILNKPIATATTPATKAGEFSDSLQKFIGRAYEKCKNDLDRTKCENALMKIMSAALKKGDLNTRDWSKHPLPIFPSEMGQANKVILTEQEMKNRDKRKSRFDSEFDNHSKEGTNQNLNSLNFKDMKQMKEFKAKEKEENIEELTSHITIVGTCQTLEKQYLRLTTIPDPSQVRPQFVLMKSLKLLKDKWKNKQADYNYISEQFRSMRQDMTIQHIQNDFTVKVYETHARIALESLDLDQFNQCQTALISLYDLGLTGHNIEFLAYRIIYTILQGIKYDMENLLKDVYAKEKKTGVISKNIEISHALKVMKAINANNYFEFFKLYKIAPNMGSNLIEPFLPRLRIKALQIASTGYFTETNVSFLFGKLAFESEAAFVKFLVENAMVLNNDKKKILFKESLNALNNSKLLTAMQYKISNIY
jgi:hypothetical protein